MPHLRSLALVLTALGLLSACSRPDAAATGTASGPGVAFVQGSYEDALARARAEKRLLLVDVYTDWCGWCKKLDREVFGGQPPPQPGALGHRGLGQRELEHRDDPRGPVLQRLTRRVGDGLEHRGHGLGPGEAGLLDPAAQRLASGQGQGVGREASVLKVLVLQRGLAVQLAGHDLGQERSIARRDERVQLQELTALGLV